MYFIIVSLALGSVYAQVGVCEKGTQCTPSVSDWSNTFKEVTDHSPKSSEPWDQSTFYDPTKYINNDNPNDNSLFHDAMCPNGVLRGLSQLFEQELPFANIATPKKSEVDYWHTLVMNHFRKIMGLEMPKHEAKASYCLHARALWADERRNTAKWDAIYPDNTCEKDDTGKARSNAHCGASFIPATAKEQNPYLSWEADEADAATKCGKTAGAEGAFRHEQGTGFGDKLAHIICQSIRVEGYWGGHTGPFIRREFFGFDFFPSGQMRAKFNGQLLDTYEDTRIGIRDTIDGFSPFCPLSECENIMYKGKAFTAGDCRDNILSKDIIEDDNGDRTDFSDCGSKYVSFNNGRNDCMCYAEGQACDKPLKLPFRKTFLLDDDGKGTPVTSPCGFDPKPGSVEATGWDKFDGQEVMGVMYKGDVFDQDTADDHGCTVANNQCFWPDEATAKEKCASWDLCHALYCSTKWDRNSKLQCYARYGGEKSLQEGPGGPTDYSFIKNQPTNQPTSQPTNQPTNNNNNNNNNNNLNNNNKNNNNGNTTNEIGASSFSSRSQLGGLWTCVVATAFAFFFA